MSTLERITLVVPPSTEPDTNDRQFYRYDQFADQLRAHTSAVLEVIEDDFATPPAAGLILLHGFGAVAHRLGANNFEDELETVSRLWSLQTRRRILCLNANRGHETLAMLERLDLAGAIDRIDYQVAVREMGFGTSYGDSGLYGLRTIADSLGCTIEYERERYCKTIVPPFASLAALLSRYLDKYWSTIT